MKVVVIEMQDICAVIPLCSALRLKRDQVKMLLMKGTLCPIYSSLFCG